MEAVKLMMQTADWKTEKHVPVIEAEGVINKGELAKIAVTVGKEIAHPNTTEHHIAWITLYFLPKGEKFPYQIGKYDFTAHGASIQGPNTSTIFTSPIVTASLKTDKAGTIIAVAYCNIHGLWGNEKELDIK